jgi:ketosteroid isomerase-like protein
MTAAEQRELHELVERYAQAVDRADGAAVAALFTDDGVLATWMDPSSGRPTGERTGRADIAAAVDGIGRYVATHHTISSHTSTVDGASATGETLCTAHHVSDDDGTRTDRVLYIRYVDAFARTSSAWLISRREVRVQWASTLPVDA